MIWSLAAGATLALFLVLIGIWMYSPRQFRGDGQIEDTGFWTYPRYHITFTQLSLTEPGEYVFRCSGLPPELLTFWMQIDGKTDHDVASSLTTVVDVRLATDDGKTVGEASGALQEWRLAWTPAEDSGRFWHRQLRNMNVARNQEYTLNVLVKDVDPSSPPLKVQPTLSGGGNELP